MLATALSIYVGYTVDGALEVPRRMWVRTVNNKQQSLKAQNANSRPGGQTEYALTNLSSCDDEVNQ